MNYKETNSEEVYIYKYGDEARYVRGKETKTKTIKTLTLDFKPTTNEFSFIGTFEPITDPIINNKVRELLGLPIKESNFFAI